jgi:hypothetical protein
MKALRIIKKFDDLTPREERALASTLNECEGAVKIIKDYIELEIVSADKELSNIKTLYSRPDSATYVAALLAQRAALFKLHNLLTEDVGIEFDDDHREKL